VRCCSTRDSPCPASLAQIVAGRMVAARPPDTGTPKPEDQLSPRG
jgi:hypothetical protein